MERYISSVKITPKVISNRIEKIDKNSFVYRHLLTEFGERIAENTPVTRKVTKDGEMLEAEIIIMTKQEFIQISELIDQLPYDLVGAKLRELFIGIIKSK